MVYQDYNIRMVFKSGPTLRSPLTKAHESKGSPHCDEAIEHRLQSAMHLRQGVYGRPSTG